MDNWCREALAQMRNCSERPGGSLKKVSSLYWRSIQCLWLGRHKYVSQVPLSDVSPYLQESILSHSHQLRLDAFRILTSHLIERTQSDEVLKRCHQGEETTLDIQGVRERILKITGAPQVVKDGDVVGADICARWLIG